MLKRYGEKALEESASRVDELAADSDHDGIGDACDQQSGVGLLGGKKLLVKDTDGNPSKRKVLVLTKDGTAIAAMTSIAGIIQGSQLRREYSGINQSGCS